MILYDLILFILPLLMIAHRRVLDFMTEKKGILLGASVALPLVHVLVSGFRWQVGLLYLVHLVLAVLALYLSAKNKHYRMNYRGVRKICSGVMATVLLLAVVFPVGVVIRPQGPYKVGTARMTLNSESGFKPAVDGLGRSIVLQFHYPSDWMGLERAPVFENGDEIERVLQKKFGVPRLFISHLSMLKSSAWYGAKVSDSKTKYPVVVMSHGWKGAKNLHENLVEEMASNGYVVVSIDHSYGSLATVLDDGTCLEFDENLAFESSADTPSVADGQEIVEMYRGDIEETLDALYEMNEVGANYIFSGRMDLGKIALIGYSAGGGAAVLQAFSDSRITAVAGLDAWLEPLDWKLMLGGLSVPYLHLESGEWQGGPNERNLNMLLTQSTEDRWCVLLEGTKHTDFTVLGDIFPFSGFTGLTGPDIKTSQAMQEDLILAFLDFYANGKNTKKALAGVISKYDRAKAEAVYMK